HVLSHFAHEAMGAAEHPAFPAPSRFPGRFIRLGHSKPRERGYAPMSLLFEWFIEKLRDPGAGWHAGIRRATDAHRVHRRDGRSLKRGGPAGAVEGKADINQPWRPPNPSKMIPRRRSRFKHTAAQSLPNYEFTSVTSFFVPLTCINTVSTQPECSSARTC